MIVQNFKLKTQICSISPIPAGDALARARNVPSLLYQEPYFWQQLPPLLALDIWSLATYDVVRTYEVVRA